MAAKKKSKKLNKLLGHTIVHVKVGDDLKDFGVHKNLICHYSPYFKAAFNSGFEETITGIIKLTETKPEVFELFYHWLYTQNLDLPLWERTESSAEAKPNHKKWCICYRSSANVNANAGYDGDDGDSDNSNCNSANDTSSDDENSSVNDDEGECQACGIHKKQCKLLIELYIFADMVQIPILQNHCMKKFLGAYERANWIPTTRLAYVWDHTTETSMLRKVMLDILVWDAECETFLSKEEYIPDCVKGELMYAMSVYLSRAYNNSGKNGSLVRPLEDITKYYVKMEEKST